MKQQPLFKLMLLLLVISGNVFSQPISPVTMAYQLLRPAQLAINEEISQQQQRDLFRLGELSLSDDPDYPVVWRLSKMNRWVEIRQQQGDLLRLMSFPQDTRHYLMAVYKQSGLGANREILWFNLDIQTKQLSSARPPYKNIMASDMLATGPSISSAMDYPVAPLLDKQGILVFEVQTWMSELWGNREAKPALKLSWQGGAFKAL